MKVTRIEKRKLPKRKMSLKCNICPKEFTYKYLLNHHIKKIHEKISSFSCDICSNGFGYKRHLKRHLKDVHENAISFVCDVCNNVCVPIIIFSIISHTK